MVDEPFGPAVESIPLRRSPLAFVVAQVRFPIVASIADQAFIGPFQERIRATYGELRHEDQAEVLIGSDGVTTRQRGSVWRFTDHSAWEVALAPDYVALATRAYTNRTEFLSRLSQVVAALQEWLHPPRIKRLGVRYIDRVTDPECLARLDELVRPEVLGPATTDTETVGLTSALTDCSYSFADDSALRARWGILGPNMTLDPTIATSDEPSWVLDLDASHEERTFDASSIVDQAGVFADRIYRYFRWAATDAFLDAHGAER